MKLPLKHPRALIDRVAKRVMLWHTMESGSQTGSAGWYDDLGRGMGAAANYWEWDPVMNMKHTWQVIEAVLARRWVDDEQRDGMTDCRLTFNPYEAEWTCAFSWSSGYAVSASHWLPGRAVCHAALSAMKGPGEK